MDVWTCGRWFIRKNRPHVHTFTPPYVEQRELLVFQNKSVCTAQLLPEMPKKGKRYQKATGAIQEAGGGPFSL